MGFFSLRSNRIRLDRPVTGATQRTGWRITMLLSGLLVAGGVWLWQKRRPPVPAPATPPMVACPIWAGSLCEPRRNLFELTEEDPPLQALQATVKPGQTLGGILGRYLDPDDLRDLDKQVDRFSFARIQSGQPYQLTVRDQQLVTFEYAISPTKKLVIESDEGDWDARLETLPVSTQTAVLTGSIDSSLFDTVQEAGGNAELATALADIFACDIDFCKEVQKGDAFRAVVEKRFVDGQFVGFGRILAAVFVNNGHTYQGIAARDAQGHWAYYDAKGKSLRKTFLRAPLSFLRITSRFSASRLHPILHRRRPHFGVDYAAPLGTPVWTVGNGVVVERGRNRAAGNYITVRHNATYVTRYNHLSRFAKGMAKGARVSQGQVIGYVGQTGYATGPHLDFRIYKNGRPINALTNTAMVADPLPAAQRMAFRRRADTLLAMLDKGSTATAVADADVEPGTPSQRLQ